MQTSTYPQASAEKACTHQMLIPGRNCLPNPPRIIFYQYLCLWNFTSFHKFCFLVFHFLSSFFYNIWTVSDACVLPLTYETSFIQLTQTSHLVFLALFIISFYLGFHSTSWNYLSPVSVLWRHFNHFFPFCKIATRPKLLPRKIYLQDFYIGGDSLDRLELESALN